MHHAGQFYIDGDWVDPLAPAVSARSLSVTDPSNEQVFAHVAAGSSADVNRAVSAAVRAFDSWSSTPVAERVALLERIITIYDRRAHQMAALISREMGAPISIARTSHVVQGKAHLAEALRLLPSFPFEQRRPSGVVLREPIGVCALITPWNWPISLIGCKLAPALAAGNTVVLKPSELAPLNAHLFAEILHEAGVPPGVFNLVDGLGPEVGDALARHPQIDAISITGSNRAGVAVAEAAAPTVKRVLQELGGKSACIVLDDADVRSVAREVAARAFRNSGQSCAALTRLLVPHSRLDEAVTGACEAAAEVVTGEPAHEATTMGPVANRVQFDRVQRYLEAAPAEGARVVAGGLGRPHGLTSGYYVRPTVLAEVTETMTVAQEEIFGPVICLMGYRDEDDAVRIANGTRYGLSGAVRSADIDRARRVARRLRTGMVHVNETQSDFGAPFGGYRQSGNGREWGAWGFEEFLETKMIFNG